LNDTRKIVDMASALGKSYPASSGSWIVGQVAALNWGRLKMKPGFGYKKLCELVELFSLAAMRLSPAEYDEHQNLEESAATKDFSTGV
jgi:hypothetical protein